MVCSIGSGRMAVMAKLLADSQNVAEEVGQQKLAAQCMYRQLSEADEANLLDEEDMQIFGLRPMTDPLDLVCCNACKKPVKASQYAAHSELCRSLSSVEEMVLEHDGVIGRRKPPKKERKKSITTFTNQATPVLEQERSDSMDADDTAASVHQLDRKPGVLAAFSMDVKRNSTYVDIAPMMDGKGVIPEYANHSACVMPPPTKRSKVRTSRHLLPSANPTSGSGKTTSLQDLHNCKDVQLQSTLRSDMPIDGVFDSKYPKHVLEPSLQTRANGICSNVVSPEVSQESTHLHTSSHTQVCSSHEQMDDHLDKRSSFAYNPDQNFVQTSEACLDKSGGCLSATNFSTQYPVDKTPRTQNGPIGLHSNKYHSKPYSFAGNSGQSLGVMQQANGSVPVL